MNIKKIYLEILLAVLVVAGCTAFVYGRLSGFHLFWDAQMIWSSILIIGWILVAIGYYHQGLMVHKNRNAGSVSILLPIIVFIVQCVLFVKGIYYHDWSLIFGAVVVNSGVIFSIYQIVRVKFFLKK